MRRSDKVAGGRPPLGQRAMRRDETQSGSAAGRRRSAATQRSLGGHEGAVAGSRGAATRFNLVGVGATSARSRARLVDEVAAKGIDHLDVLDALAAVPRHIFVDEALNHLAYQDRALPIGHGQTISQPFTVATMTAVLLDVPRRSVLEVGTGSGFQTAVLAQLCETVFSVERVQPLLLRAQERFRAMRINNVQTKLGDGYQGWPEKGPFAGILVTAAPRATPRALFEQLAVGGRMVVPVGSGGAQELRVYDRTATGFAEQVMDAVRFVPLVKGLQP